MLNEKLNKASKCLAIKFQTLTSFPRITNASGAPFHLSSDRSGNPILKYDFTGNEITSKQSFASCLSCISFFRKCKSFRIHRFAKIAFAKMGQICASACLWGSQQEKKVSIQYLQIYWHIRNVPVLKYRNIHIVHDIHKIFTNQICVVGEILNLIIQSTLLQYYYKSLFV